MVKLYLNRNISNYYMMSEKSFKKDSIEYLGYFNSNTTVEDIWNNRNITGKYLKECSENGKFHPSHDLDFCRALTHGDIVECEGKFYVLEYVRYREIGNPLESEIKEEKFKI